jgi:hypothetical protein
MAWAFRPPHDRCCFDRVELSRIHRHRDKRGEAHHLRRPRSARGLLHP